MNEYINIHSLYKEDIVMHQIIRRKEKKHLMTYFGITFIMLGVITLIFLVNDFSLLKYGWLFLIGTLSPTIAAVVVSAYSEGKKGVVELLRGWIRWKVNFIYYIIALVPAAISIIWFMFEKYRGHINYRYIDIIPIIIFAILIGPLGEETGWRGFALPRLQKKYSCVMSTIILGTIWSVFHLPLWFVRDSMQTMPFWIFYIMIVSSSFIYTFLYNKTNSLLLTFLFHFSFNFAGNLIISSKLIDEKVYFYVAAIFYVVYALILIRKIDSKLNPI